MPDDYGNSGLPVTLDQTTPAVFQGRRIGNIGDVAKNAFTDLKDMGTGAVALGNLGMARGYELLPLPGNIPMPLVRPGDPGRMQQMGKAIVDSYKTNYVEPFTTRHPENLAKYAAAHPLNFGLDAAPLLKVPGVGKLTGMVGSAMEKLPAVVKAQEIAGDAAARAGLTAETASDLPLGPAAQMTPMIKGGVQVAAEAAAKVPALEEAAKVVQDLLKKTNATQEATALKQSYEANVLAENVAINNRLGKAWHKIPMELRDQVRPYAEGHHPELLKGNGIPDVMKEYLQIAEEYSAKMRERIKPFTQGQDLNLEKYQPATMKRLGLTKEQYTALSAPERAQRLLDTKNALDKLGIEPQYSPHVNHDEVGRTLANPSQIKGSIKNKPLDVDNQHFLKEKTSTGQYATDSHFDALRTRWIQIGQLHNAYETLVRGAIKHGQQVDALEHAMEQAAMTGIDDAVKQIEADLAAQGLHPVSGPAIVDSVMGGLQGSIVSGEELAHLAETLIPKKLFVPEAFAEALNKMFKPSKTSGLARWFGKFNTVAKRYMLGGNVTYPEAQFVQAAPMLELVSMNGPISTMHSLVAYALLMNKAVREAVPLSIAENVMAAEVETTRYLDNFAKKVLSSPGINKLPSKMQKGIHAPFKLYDDFVDFTLKRNAIYDNLLRAKAAIQYALDDNSPVTKAMWKTADAAAELENYFKDPAKLAGAAKDVNRKLGDFQALSNSTLGRAMSTVTLFPSWFMYITDYAARLPFNNPFKTAIVSKLNQVSEKYIADPNVPDYLKGAVKIAGPGPNGQPRVVNKTGANPLTSPGELAQVLNALIQGDADESAVTMLPPLLQLGFIYTAHLMPSTRQPYKDPGLLTTRSGKAYRFGDLNDNMKLEAVESFPNFIPQVFETLFPPLTRTFERFLEKARSGGERSVMSDIFKTAPKTFSPGGGVTAIRKAPDWITMAVQEIINNKPIEYNPDARFKNEKQAIQEQHELWKKFAKSELDLQKLMKQ